MDPFNFKTAWEVSAKVVDPLGIGKAVVDQMVKVGKAVVGEAPHGVESPGCLGPNPMKGRQSTDASQTPLALSLLSIMYNIKICVKP